MLFLNAITLLLLFCLRSIVHDSFTKCASASYLPPTLREVPELEHIEDQPYQNCSVKKSIYAHNIVPTVSKSQYYGKLILSFQKIKKSKVNCIWLIKPSLLQYQHHRLLSRKKSVLTVKNPGRFGTGAENDLIIEFYGVNEKSIHRKAEYECGIYKSSSYFSPIPDYFSNKNIQSDISSKFELIPLHVSGPSQNRMDMIMMGDGYTTKEYTMFLQDMQRMSSSLINSTTFQSFLPLLNIWALFVPSEEHGIGVKGKARNTAFGLYRDGTELRGIYSSKPHIARSICRNLGNELCDFPSLIANDDYYGGLGGEFVITTRSPTSGVMVLKHEMGHNFIQVGEEYDDGQVYNGVNSAKSLNEVRKWAQWMTPTKSNVSEEKLSRLLSDHVWRVLTPHRPKWKKEFYSTGIFSRWFLRISLSGFVNDKDLEIRLDGKLLPWKSEGNLDRTFYEWYSTVGFTKGHHDIQINLLNFNLKTKVPTQVCDLSLNEYGDEKECHFSLPKENKVMILGDKYAKIPNDEYIAAFPTWSYRNQKSYRPTNEYCLMRNMKSNNLCSVCTEGLWINFLSRIQLIDFVTFKDGHILLEVIRLGQFRPKRISNEYMTIQWFNESGEMTQFKNNLNAYGLTPGRKYIVKVNLETPSVRVASRVLTSSVAFQIPNSKESLSVRYL
ncbi:hypothetical protein HMI55_004031 [Coelomomyces lativittatus]|nr:hypothetical protein HMI56_000847 [Coelomomyces lativittatus]KAJ1518005.1 hypothetical protein HMI55_004031 [Coelomomyces lativittatus]